MTMRSLLPKARISSVLAVMLFGSLHLLLSPSFAFLLVPSPSTSISSTLTRQPESAGWIIPSSRQPQRQHQYHQQQRSSLFAASSTTSIANTTSTLPSTSHQDKEDDAAIAALLSQHDPTVEAPLPPAFAKCPFNGILAGPQSFYRQASAALQSPKLFSFVHRDQPMVEVCHGPAARVVLNQEFTSFQSNAVKGISQVICGTESLRTAQDAKEHQQLRQLVGVPLSRQAVAVSLPKLEDICRTRVQEMIHAKTAIAKNNNQEKVITVYDVTQAMAMDMVWQQVLGLDLTTPAEIKEFHAQTATWLQGMYSKPGSPELEATMQAKEYLVNQMHRKIEQLHALGHSDGSTMGGLVYAEVEDEEDDNIDASSQHKQKQTHRLSTQQVIDNALVLILGGVETTAGNTANAMLLMGLHPHVWHQVVQEQQSVMAQHGPALTEGIILNHDSAPYLEAVMKETLRILPTTLVSRRVTSETLVIDNQQIPKGWGVSYNMFLTHQNDPQLEADCMDLLHGFQPQRWLSFNEKDGGGDDDDDDDSDSLVFHKPSQQHYLPFGAGPRHCPGATLALAEMKALLSLLAREVPSFQLKMPLDTSSNQPVDAQIPWRKLAAVPVPEDGVKIMIPTA